MRWLLNKKAQNTLEYALLIAVVVGAFVIMQIYGKRGVEGKLRSSADDIGSQFDPLATESSWTTERSSKTVEITNATGLSTTYMDGTTENSKAGVTTTKGYDRVSGW
jgi:uncharacterized protein (UPF0333 family)